VTRTFGLVLKPIQFELLAMVGLCVAVTVGALYVVADISHLGDMAACIRQQDMGQLAVASTCGNRLEAFDSLRYGEAQQVLGFMAVLPYVVGLVLGVTVVAREIETGTAPLAWALAGSRVRWIFARLLRVAPVVVALLIVPVIVSDVLEGQLEPTVSPGASFIDWGSRGFPLIAYGLIAFAIAVAAGAILGRVLPALIVAALVCVVLNQGLHPLMRRWLDPQAVQLPTLTSGMSPVDQSGVARASLKFGEVAYDPSGHVIDDLPAWIATHQAEAHAGNGAAIISLVVPGSRYLQVELIESTGLLLGSLGAAAAAAFVVRRRAPY
jgi:hypothetical protein